MEYRKIKNREKQGVEMSKRKRKQKKKDAIPQTEYLLYTDGGCEFNPGGRVFEKEES